MNHKFVKGIALLTIAEVISKLKILLIIPLITKNMEMTDYGIWSQVGVLVAVTTPIIFVGTDASMNRFFSGKSIDQIRSVFSAWMLFLFVSMTLIASILLFFQSSIGMAFFSGQDNSRELMIFSILALITNVLLNAFRIFMRVCDKAKWLTIFNITQAVLSVLTIIIVLSKWTQASSIIIGTIISDMFLITITVVLFSLYHIWSKPDFSIIHGMIRYGAPLVPIAYAMWALNSLDRLFIIRFSNMDELAVYSMSYGIGSLITQMITGPVFTMYPNTAVKLYENQDLTGLKSLYSRSLLLILTTMLPAIFGIAAIGDQLIVVLSTGDYIQGSKIIVIVMVAYLFAIISSYGDITFQLVNKQKYSTYTITFAAILNALLNAILVPRYGILGAGISTILSFCVYAIISIVVSQKYIRMHLNVLPVIKLLLISIAMGFLTFILKKVIPFQNVFSLMLLMLSGATFYIVCVIKLRIITIDNVRSLLRGKN